MTVDVGCFAILRTNAVVDSLALDVATPEHTGQIGWRALQSKLSNGGFSLQPNELYLDENRAVKVFGFYERNPGNSYVEYEVHRKDAWYTGRLRRVEDLSNHHSTVLSGLDARFLALENLTRGELKLAVDAIPQRILVDPVVMGVKEQVIQQLRAENDSLRSRLEQLEKELETLKKKIDQ